MNVASVDLPYLWTATIKGRQYAYYRRAGLRTRLPLLDTPGFLAAYQAAHDEAEARAAAVNRTPAAGHAPGSLAALVTAYKASPEWAALSPATRTDYLKALNPLAERFGRPQVAQMTRAFVFKLRDEYAMSDGKPTPRRANRMVAVLSLLISWGINRGWRKDNPAAKPGRLKTGPGYATWSPDEVDAFMGCETIGEPMKRAFVLGLCTGQRKQDCLAMTKAARRDGAVEVVQLKTGARVWIPEHPDLTRTLDGAPATDAVTILTRADGKPWQDSHFTHQFAAAVKLAGLAALTFHGLRKTAASWLAEGGCSASDIMAITGHRTMAEVTRYTAAADQRGRAASAMRKLAKRRIGNVE